MCTNRYITVWYIKSLTIVAQNRRKTAEKIACDMQSTVEGYLLCLGVPTCYHFKNLHTYIGFINNKHDDVHMTIDIRKTTKEQYGFSKLLSNDWFRENRKKYSKKHIQKKFRSSIWFFQIPYQNSTEECRDNDCRRRSIFPEGTTLNHTRSTKSFMTFFSLYD